MKGGKAAWEQLILTKHEVGETDGWMIALNRPRPEGCDASALVAVHRICQGRQHSAPGPQYFLCWRVWRGRILHNCIRLTLTCKLDFFHRSDTDLVHNPVENTLTSVVVRPHLYNGDSFDVSVAFGRLHAASLLTLVLFVFSPTAGAHGQEHGARWSGIQVKICSQHSNRRF